jgi:hypothetical protein
MIAFNQTSDFKFKVKRLHAFNNKHVKKLIQMVQVSDEYSNQKLAFITNRSPQYTHKGLRDYCSENDIVLFHTVTGQYSLLASHNLFTDLRKQFR